MINKQNAPRVTLLTLVILTVLFGVFLLIGIAQAQAIDPSNPQTWILNPSTILMAANLITGFVVYFFTAFFKGILKTDGNQTVLISFAIALGISLVVGYKGLGGFMDYQGVQGALNVAIMTIWAFVQSNGQAKANRQVLSSQLNAQSK